MSRISTKNKIPLTYPPNLNSFVLNKSIRLITNSYIFRDKIKDSMLIFLTQWFQMVKISFLTIKFFRLTN